MQAAATPQQLSASTRSRRAAASVVLHSAPSPWSLLPCRALRSAPPLPPSKPHPAPVGKDGAWHASPSPSTPRDQGGGNDTAWDEARAWDQAHTWLQSHAQGSEQWRQAWRWDIFIENITEHGQKVVLMRNKEAVILNDMGQRYADIGDHTAAERMHAQALQALQPVWYEYGSGLASVAATPHEKLNHLITQCLMARSRVAMGDVEGAVALWCEVMEELQMHQHAAARNGEDEAERHACVAFIKREALAVQVACLQAEGKHAAAEQVVRSLLLACWRDLGRGDPQTIRCMVERAVSLQAVGKGQLARSWLRKAQGLML